MSREHPMADPARREGAATVIDHLRRHDRAAVLLPAAQRMLQLSQDVLALMPAVLRKTCEVYEYSGPDSEGGVVVLRVSSASAAAKLRQTAPRLRDGLVDRGWQVSAIRIRVQPWMPPAESAESAAKSSVSLSPAGIAAFAELAESLASSPLKGAVERLLARRKAAGGR